MLKSLKQKLNNALHDNSGASLLELIIAVTILAIITAPLLNTFVISAKLNAKAKTMGLETNVATSIYEKIKAADSSFLMDVQSTASSDGTVNTDTPSAESIKIGNLFNAKQGAELSDTAGSDGSVKKRVMDLKGVGSGKRQYDARITMDAIPTGSDGLVSFTSFDNDFVTEDNKTPRTEQMSFDHVWVQPDGTSGDPDTAVMSYIPERITTTPNSDGEVIKKNERHITITLRNTETYSDAVFSDGETGYNSDGTSGDVSQWETDSSVSKWHRATVRAVITYEYDIEWLEKVVETKNVDGVNKQVETLVTKRIYTNNHSQTKPDDSEAQAIYTTEMAPFTYYYPSVGSKNTHMFDLMIFFKPYYKGTAPESGYKEDITINNQNNLDGDIFLIKEKPDDAQQYSGLIRLIENHPSDMDNFHLQLHTNIGLAKNSSYTAGNKIALSGGLFRFIKVYDGENFYKSMENVNSADPKYAVSTIIKQRAYDHIYKVSVELYDKGDLGGKTKFRLSGIKVG